MTIFFTSDLHYGHANIIRYCNRPFKTVEEMNETLIKNYNSRVGPQDTCYFIGDFCFMDRKDGENIVRRLNGNKTLIKGNHDKLQNYQGMGFGSVHDYLEIKVPDEDARQGIQRITLLHYAMRVWNQSHRGAWQLYGHSHGSLQDDPHSLSMDVGVDTSNYSPISYEEVKAKMKLKKWKPIDGHGKGE
jgi:calcineurin-like phosphoesterase family protein